MTWFYRLYCRDKKRYAGGFNFFEAHHYFWGIILMLLAFFLLFKFAVSMWIVQIVFWLGVWVMLDDFYQHSVQRRQMIENEEKYGVRFYTAHTFWHVFPYWLIRKW